VDDFALACKEEATAIEIYDIIGRSLRLEKEPVDPFSYLDLVKDFNGVGIAQRSSYIQISCANYIDRVLTTHSWTTAANMKQSSKPVGTLPADAIHKIYQELGPAEGIAEHQALEETCGFGYITLLRKMMCAYVTCRPDIGYAITTMSYY